MPLVEVPIPNLLGGVSNQPASQRTPGQVEALDNGLVHVVNGLAKRKGSRHIAKLIDGLESVRLVHLSNRSPEDRFVFLVGERRLRVFSATDGSEFPVRVNGTATAAGRGEETSGAPINYLDPRTPGGVIDQDEDFVIGAGDWLSVAGNSVTSYVDGRGPFAFGRRQSLTAVTADTVAEVGNGAAATVSDIYQDFEDFTKLQVFSVFVKKSSSAISDVELAFVTTDPDTYGARFAIDGNGVVTFAAFRVPDGFGGTIDSPAPGFVYRAEVEPHADGWYRCSIFFRDTFDAMVLPIVGTTRRLQVRFHTTGATPANKRALLFGGRCYDNVLAQDPVPAYVYVRSDLFRSLSIADTTFLLNTETVTALNQTPQDVLAFGNRPLYVWVRNSVGAADITYNVVVKFTTLAVPDTATATFTTGASTHDTAEDIAEDLRADLDADADLIADRFGSVIRIRHATAGATSQLTSVSVSDGRGDSSMVAFSFDPDSRGEPSVTRFSDLPLDFFDDQVVRVRGDGVSPVDDYWVKFSTQDPAAVGSGIWLEDRRPAQLTLVDAATMPVRVTRLQDDAAGTITGVPNAIYFDVSNVTWDNKLVGSEVSNPTPSFFGHALQDLFLYRGRLGFLADDNVVLSEAGEIFNFWRTTVLDLVDTDPIDVDSGARDSVTFRNAVATADSLLLFSERRQFQLLGEPVLSPNTAQLSPVRTFENLGQARPVDSGRGAIFARADDAFSGLMEASLLQDDVNFRFTDLTIQAPRYIPGRVLELAYSSLISLAVASSDDARNVVFLHQAFRDDQENQLQSAVHRWIFDESGSLHGMGFLDAELRLVWERAEGWFLETVLTDSETTEGGRPVTHLDRRVDQDQVTRTYAGGPDETTIELPYEISDTATMQVVDAESGLIIPILSQTDTEVVVRGDVTDTDLYVGERYDLVVVLSEPVIQEQGARGIVPRMGRPLDVNLLHLYLADTAYLEVEVAADLRAASVEEFSAAGLGTGLLLEGELTLFTGDASFAMIGRSTELTVTLRNPTPFPSYVQAGRWECLYRARAATA